MAPEERSEFIRGPRWRVEAPAAKRRTAALITFAVVCAVGVVVMVGTMLVLDALGTPGWVVILPWLGPTLGSVVWSIVRARPAVATDDEEAWVTYSVKWALTGPDDPRPAPVRVVVAVVFGGPAVWAIGIFWILAIIGLVDA